MRDFHFNISTTATRSIRNRTLKRDEVLFAIGSPVESLFRVVEGSVRAVAYPDGDRPLVLYRAMPGELVSEDHLACEKYRYSAIAAESSVVESICRKLFVREIQQSPNVIYQFVECLCGRFRQLNANFERIAIPDAKTRVLYLLHNLTKHESESRFGRIDLRGKIKSYADDLNLSHEAMYRSLRKLESDGSIVRFNDGSIRVISQAISN